jgi:hypothetical protein
MESDQDEKGEIKIEIEDTDRSEEDSFTDLDEMVKNAGSLN